MDLFVVLTTIKFNDQFDGGTIEIDYIRPNWLLPSKAQSANLFPA
ncbi:MAG TPA: hypothetical protein VFW28_17670 [Micropepsaceae bacterium]|nr:hypothetical protein [Micropepsaceae bacterium]